MDGTRKRLKAADKNDMFSNEVVKADLNRPETLKAAFEGTHGVFPVTNNWEEGTDELKQATPAILGFRFARPNCARKQDSRPATDQVLDVGPSEFPG